MERSLLRVLGTVFLILTSTSVGNTNDLFEIAGLFTTDVNLDANTRETYGVYPMEAAKMAIEHVNAHGFLAEHNYELILGAVETSCDQAGAVIATSEFSTSMGYSPDVPFAVLGPVCSTATELIALLASEYLNTVIISFGARSPLFSNTNLYSHFYRTVPSYSEYNRPIFAIMQHFDWQFVGVVHSENAYYTTALEDLASLFVSQNSPAQIQASLGFRAHLGLDGPKSSTDTRIYIAMVEERHAIDTMCAAFRSGLTGSRYLWILLGDYVDGWWRKESVKVTSNNRKFVCTNEEMLNAIESTIIITTAVRKTLSERTFSSITGQNQSEFWDEFQRRVENNTGLNYNPARTIRVLQSYDAVWSIAKALNQTLANGNFSQPENLTYSFTLSSFITPKVVRLHRSLNQNMQSLSFLGTSGQINFTEEVNSQENPTTIVYQMQNGQMVRVGIHSLKDPDNKYILNLSYFDNNFTWQGNGPPRDRPKIIQQFVELWLVVVMLCVTFLGIVFAIVILALNWVYRKHKVIKASSPYINIIIVTGCLLGFFTVPILSIESLDIFDSIPLHAYLFFCNARPWLISFSITLSFGALFAKTLRVYVIFRNPWQKKRPLKDRRLIALVAGLLVIDVIVLGIWSGLFPLELTTVLWQADDGEFIVYAYKVCIIGSNFENLIVWLVVISVLKGILFLSGTFIVVQTNKIKAKFFQESKFVGIAMYAVVIVCGTGVPASLTLMHTLKEDMGYVSSTSVILLCCFLILGLVFIPRLVLLKKYRHKVPTAVLLGLNPSFRIKRPNRYYVSKRTRSDDGSPAIHSPPNKASTPSANSMVCLIDKDDSHTRSLDDDISTVVNLDSVLSWEPAYDEELIPPEVTVQIESGQELGEVQYMSGVIAEEVDNSTVGGGQQQEQLNSIQDDDGGHVETVAIDCEDYASTEQS